MNFDILDCCSHFWKCCCPLAGFQVSNGTFILALIFLSSGTLSHYENVLPWSKQTQKTRVTANMASETLEREANFVYHFQSWCIILLSFFLLIFGVVPFLLSFKILRITSWGTRILTLAYDLEYFFLIFMYISI